MISFVLSFLFGGLIVRAWIDFRNDDMHWAVWDASFALLCLVAWISNL